MPQLFDKVVRHLDNAAFAGLGDFCREIEMLPLEIQHAPYHSAGFLGIHDNALSAHNPG